jgi:hypothetical protein
VKHKVTELAVAGSLPGRITGLLVIASRVYHAMGERRLYRVLSARSKSASAIREKALKTRLRVPSGSSLLGRVLPTAADRRPAVTPSNNSRREGVTAAS